MGERNSGETPTPKPTSRPAAPSPDAGANCAFASRYPSLRHAGSCQPVRDSLGKRRLLGGKLSATAELCEECMHRLEEHGFCLKCLGCNCVTGANGKVDCIQHGPGGTQGFTAPPGHKWTEVCDECTGAATKAKQKTRAADKSRDSQWTAAEVARRQAAHQQPALPLTIARRAPIEFADYSVSFMTELYRQYRNQGKVHWLSPLKNKSKPDSDAVWSAFGTQLATAETIGSHHNYCRILFTDPRRRGDTPAACIERIWNHMHLQHAFLRDYKRADKTIDWVAVTGNPARS